MLQNILIIAGQMLQNNAIVYKTVKRCSQINHISLVKLPAYQLL